MKQSVENKKKTETPIKRLVSDQFLKSIDQSISEGVVKNRRDFAIRIKEDQAEFSKIKNVESKRYVDVEMMYKAVNELGLNANHFLLADGDKTEPLQRIKVQINGGTVNGNHNVVLTGQAVSNSGDVYLNVEKLVQSLPGKDKKAILDKIGNLEIQNSGLNAQIEDLKKTIDRYEREMEKDKKIIEAQEKLIRLMEKTDKKK